MLGAKELEKLLSGSGTTLDELLEKNEAVELPGELELALSSRHRALESPNIIARTRRIRSGPA